MKLLIALFAVHFSIASISEARDLSPSTAAFQAYQTEARAITARMQAGQISPETADRLQDAAYHRYLRRLEEIRIEEIEREIDLQEYRDDCRRRGRYTRR